MDKIEFIVGSPPPYSNHVTIERTQGGTYRCQGTSNASGAEPAYLSARHFGDLEAAKLAARRWASEHGVTRVYLPPVP